MPKIFSQFTTCLITQIDANIYMYSDERILKTIRILSRKKLFESLFAFSRNSYLIEIIIQLWRLTLKKNSIEPFDLQFDLHSQTATVIG